MHGACYENFCGANQWTGFYMISASVMKGLIYFRMRWRREYLNYFCEPITLKFIDKNIEKILVLSKLHNITTTIWPRGKILSNYKIAASFCEYLSSVSHVICSTNLIFLCKIYKTGILQYLELTSPSHWQRTTKPQLH